MANYSDLCEICEINPVDTTLTCEHYFCSLCLKLYLLKKIRDGEVSDLNCPKCNMSLKNEEIKSLSSEESYLRYQELLIINEGLKTHALKRYYEPNHNFFDLFYPLCNSYQITASLSKSYRKKYTLSDGSLRKIFWCRICECELNENHSFFNCLIGKKLNNCYWSSIFILLFFPISYFFLYYFAIWYMIESFEIPCRCCCKFKILNKLIAFVLSPIMGLLFFPLIMDGLLFQYLASFIYRNATCHLSLAVFLFFIVYPILIGIYIYLGIIFSIGFPFLGLFLLILKVVNILRSSK